MKTAIWLYLFMFVAFFDLHAQYPILSPFALSLGAAPSFIGLILGMYSITHIPGNIIAGYGVDRFGSKKFIVASLIMAGIILVFQSHVTNPWQLLVIRSISGFVLAFLSPACLAWLAKLAKNRIHQGKLMAGNGLVHTLASVVSPAAGALLVAKLGFSTSFTILGWGLICTGLLSIVGIKETPYSPDVIEHQISTIPIENNTTPIPWLFFGIPLAISCSQGILFFELPLISSAKNSILTSGLLFSLVSLGALLTLSMLFLNRYSAFFRIVFGCLSLALSFFGLAIHWAIPLSISLVLIGMSKGIIFPAIATLLAGITSSGHYGRVFSILSIAYSIGAFIGPVAAGQMRMSISPFFLAFSALMLGLIIIPFDKYRAMASIR
ncbi:MAG: transporter [Bacilli bacterium]|nr:transporter [Bacilli bacterium]